jgi:polysaccharide pyruvyl transferase WcaK-like protein
MSPSVEIKGFYTGCINSGNIGDDILYLIFILLLRSSLNKKFSIVEVYNNSFKVDALSWRDLSDIRIFGGGTLIHNYDNTYAGMINDGKFSMAFGTGINPDFNLNNSNICHFINREYDKIDYITNDTIKVSLNNLSGVKSGGLRGPMSVLFSKKVNNTDIGSYMYDAGLLSNCFINFRDSSIELCQKKKNIGVSIVHVVGPHRLGSSDNETIEEYNSRIFEEIYKVCIKLLETGEYNIVFFDMSNSSDKQLSKLMYDKIKESHESLINYVTHFPNTLTFEDILKIASQCFLTIGTRLHANVLSAAVLTPFISISYCFKCVDFAESVDLQDLTIPTFYITEKDIINKFYKITKEYGDIVRKLKVHISNAYTKYFKDMDYLVESFLKEYDPFGTSDKAVIRYNTDHHCVGVFKIELM